jgi:hypothetical protein
MKDQPLPLTPRLRVFVATFRFAEGHERDFLRVQAATVEEARQLTAERYPKARLASLNEEVWHERYPSGRTPVCQADPFCIAQSPCPVHEVNA